jgi:hypothetical protein
MKWFFAVSEVSMDHHDHDFRALIRSAVNSARANTQLVPHMIFYDRLEAAQRAQRPDWTSYMFVASGALLRLEIPLLEQRDDFVLYTDCDVIFLNDPVLDHVRPDVFAVAPERQQGSHEDMNSGVMVMNLPRLRADLPTLVTFLCEKFTTVNGFDQEAYRHFYQGAWSGLPTDYNWKPYWGVNTEASVIHFHGPKPPAVRKLIADPGYGAPDVWRELYFQNPESYRTYLAIWAQYQVAALTG